MSSDLWDPHELATQVFALKEKGERIVFTNGCFDLIHRGHVEYLIEAKNLGSYLVIGLNTDQSVQRLKGADRPLNALEDRARVLAQLKPVDAVTWFAEETPLSLIRQIQPDILVKGGDWSEDQIVGASEVNSLGGEVYALPYRTGHSTSELIEKIRSR